MLDILNNKSVKLGSWALSAIGAANWGLVEVMNTKILTDVLMLSSDLEGVGYIVIGVAGVVSLLDLISSEA